MGKKKVKVLSCLKKMKAAAPDKSRGNFDGPVTISPKASLVGKKKELGEDYLHGRDGVDFGLF